MQSTVLTIRNGEFHLTKNFYGNVFPLAIEESSQAYDFKERLLANYMFIDFPTTSLKIMR